MDIIIVILVLFWNLLVFLFHTTMKLLNFFAYIVCTYWKQIGVILVFCFACLCVHALISWVDNKIKEWRTNKLKKHLEEYCLKCGYMDNLSWKKLLPDFASKQYITSFQQITDEFAKQVQSIYIDHAEGLPWLQPVTDYLSKNIMADVYELSKISNPGLEYTHRTPDAKLIREGMDRLSVAMEKEGKKLIQRVPLDECEMMKAYPELRGGEVGAYLMAYRMNEDFVSKERMTAGNLVSKEMSLEDLENTVG